MSDKYEHQIIQLTTHVIAKNPKEAVLAVVSPLGLDKSPDNSRGWALQRASAYKLDPFKVNITISVEPISEEPDHE